MKAGTLFENNQTTEFPMRGLSDYILDTFAERMLPTVVGHELAGGRQTITFSSGQIVQVSPFASDTEIERAVREAFNMNDEPKTELPAVELPQAPQPSPPVSDKIPGVISRGHRPGALAAALRGVKERHASVVAQAIDNIAGLHKTLDQVQRVGNDARETDESIRAELGEFTNFADE